MSFKFVTSDNQSIIYAVIDGGNGYLLSLLSQVLIIDVLRNMF